MKTFAFNKIFVIESLRSGDEKTGETLYSETIRLGMLKKGDDYKYEFLSVKSKNDFFVAIENIKSEIESENNYPVLHIEMHGSPEGIQTSNLEFISWLELQNRIVELNISCKGNLFLTMATCYGSYIFKLIKPNLTSPFWGFVGSFDEIFPDEIMTNYKAFYEEFIDSLNINKAIDKLNSINNLDSPKFRFYNTEFAFDVAYKNYENKYLTPEVVKTRIDKLILEARSYNTLKGENEEKLRKEFRHIIVDMNKEKLKQQFFRFN